jgi:type I restriction enzyme, R subunit
MEGQWDELTEALRGLISEVRAGQVAPDGLASDLPEHYGPFLRLIADAAAGVRAPSEAQSQLFTAVTAEVVETIVAELVPNFWKPYRRPAQDALSARIFELLMRSRLALVTPQVEALVDKLIDLARANHDRLLKC